MTAVYVQSGFKPEIPSTLDQDLSLYLVRRNYAAQQDQESEGGCLSMFLGFEFIEGRIVMKRKREDMT